MKPEAVLNDEILEATAKIRKDYPELIKFLDELPQHLPDDSNQDVNLKALNDYLNSLNELMENYSKEH